MGYSEKDEFNMLLMQGMTQAILFKKRGYKFTPSKHECPFCHKEFEGVPKWCPHCRKRVTKPGTSELI